MICEVLDALVYKVEQRVMNACEYGNVPQNRERIYVVVFRDEAD
ncbi:DNA cytosine methyltransferase [uncultured Robinsoniella sp.]